MTARHSRLPVRQFHQVAAVAQKISLNSHDGAFVKFHFGSADIDLIFRGLAAALRGDKNRRIISINIGSIHSAKNMPADRVSVLYSKRYNALRKVKRKKSCADCTLASRHDSTSVANSEGIGIPNCPACSRACRTPAI